MEKAASISTEKPAAAASTLADLLWVYANDVYGIKEQRMVKMDHRNSYIQWLLEWDKKPRPPLPNLPETLRTMVAIKAQRAHDERVLADFKREATPTSRSTSSTTTTRGPTSPTTSTTSSTTTTTTTNRKKQNASPAVSNRITPRGGRRHLLVHLRRTIASQHPATAASLARKLRGQRAAPQLELNGQQSFMELDGQRAMKLARGGGAVVKLIETAAYV
ncbi:hypothetical protein ZWY2020_001151 [Hordeum vulgare]|nr:hypothetical protein ZWY2020_001151 [Hordeum vulgare]